MIADVIADVLAGAWAGELLVEGLTPGARLDVIDTLKTGFDVDILVAVSVSSPVDASADVIIGSVFGVDALVDATTVSAAPTTAWDSAVSTP